jgi:hypothetical protein
MAPLLDFSESKVRAPDDSTLRRWDQLSRPKLLYFEQYNIIIGQHNERPKFTDLPMEIQFNVMTEMDGEDLERLVIALDKWLPRIVQYVEDIPRNTPKGKIQSVALDILEENYSLMNIVHISLFKDLNVDSLLKQPNSINHITISGIEMNVYNPDEQQQKLANLLNHSTTQTKITIIDCNSVSLQYIDVMPSRLKLMNIKTLKIDRCTLKTGTWLEIHAVENLYQVDCNKDFIQRMNFTKGAPWEVFLLQDQTMEYLIGE